MSVALILALSLFAQDTPGALDAPIARGSQPTQTAVAASLASRPRGAPSGDYELVGWCYGALRGYLDLHDEVMPEVRRIESTYRRPGSNLADDLKVYAEQQRQGRKDLTRFQSAITAAEKASLRPLNQQGAEAVRRGQAVWAAGPEVSKARKAQEWMSWSLPAVCNTTAENLQARSALAGAALRVNENQPSSTDPVAPADQAAAPEAQILTPIGAKAPEADAVVSEPAPPEVQAGDPPPPFVVVDPSSAAPEAAPSEAASAEAGGETPAQRRLRLRQEATGQTN